MIKPSAKPEMLSTLRTLLQDALRLQAEGAGCLRLGRAQGAADGFMRALIEAGVASTELLAIVAEERAAQSGPATQVLGGEGASVAA